MIFQNHEYSDRIATFKNLQSMIEYKDKFKNNKKNMSNPNNEVKESSQVSDRVDKTPRTTEPVKETADKRGKEMERLKAAEAKDREEEELKKDQELDPMEQEDADDLKGFCEKNGLTLNSFVNGTLVLRVTDNLSQKVPSQELMKKNGNWQLGTLKYGNLEDAASDLKAIANLLRFASQRKPDSDQGDHFEVKKNGLTLGRNLITFNSRDVWEGYLASIRGREVLNDVRDLYQQRGVDQKMDGLPFTYSGDAEEIRQYLEAEYNKIPR